MYVCLYHVCTCVCLQARAKGFKGPMLGGDSNPRAGPFTEAELRQGLGMPGAFADTPDSHQAFGRGRGGNY